MRRPLQKLAIALLALATATGAGAQSIQIGDVWARPTVPGQTASGAYMSIRSAEEAQIVGVATPVAVVAQVHRMSMHGTTMSMEAVPALELPAGKTVMLQPNGLHIMLFDLKAPLLVGQQFPLTLRIDVGHHKVIEKTVVAEVRPFASAAK